MYDSEISTIEHYRVQFDQECSSHDPDARTTGTAYLSALGALVDAFNCGAGADADLMGHDTTGTLSRVEERVVWAETERHRVRQAMSMLH